MAMPVKKISAGAVQVAIWENEASGAHGAQGSYHTVSMERRYKDKEGNWKSTGSLKMNDLPKAVLALQKAYEHIAIRDTSASADAAADLC